MSIRYCRELQGQRGFQSQSNCNRTTVSSKYFRVPVQTQRWEGREPFKPRSFSLFRTHVQHVGTQPGAVSTKAWPTSGDTTIKKLTDLLSCFRPNTDRMLPRITMATGAFDTVEVATWRSAPPPTPLIIRWC